MKSYISYVFPIQLFAQIFVYSLLSQPMLIVGESQILSTNNEIFLDTWCLCLVITLAILFVSLIWRLKFFLFGNLKALVYDDSGENESRYTRRSLRNMSRSIGKIDSELANSLNEWIRKQVFSKNAIFLISISLFSYRTQRSTLYEKIYLWLFIISQFCLGQFVWHFLQMYSIFPYISHLYKLFR